MYSKKINNDFNEKPKGEREELNRSIYFLLLLITAIRLKKSIIRLHAKKVESIGKAMEKPNILIR